MRSDRDPIDASAVRNLDEIQEDDPGARPSRAGALVLASLGGACIVFAAALLMRSPPKAKVTSQDPLGDLVAQARPAGATSAAPATVGQDVTFPAVLSDAKHPTTALEAVRDAKGEFVKPAASGLPFDLPPGAPTTPPPATDRLPVVPLPAQHVLQGPPADPPPNDTLGAMAKQASRETGDEAPAGGPGGHQLQVSSFKTQVEADSFAAALRRRGHKAYVEPAQVKGRGLWYRVRIGPFKYRHSAVVYRQDFEAKERMVTFIVDPPKPGAKPKNDDE
ncbi:Adventurous gliding motility protein I [Minicystis rosea]|nr:Adventurous gliding motility protein I [Minicystis rosea]